MRAIPKDIELPIYWKTTLKEVEEALELVKNGKVTKECDSAGGRPIYMVEYGKSNLPKGTANLSSALGAHHPECYADKSGEDYIPTVFLVGCIHGGEFEGTCAMLNLIKILETGTDYAGKRYDELKELAEKVHLVLIPMVNPDGRSHIPFNTFVGKTFEDLRYFNQGTWKDGSLAGWPECKMKHPILPYVDYLGGYFNDDGVNMMHEDFIGGKLSTGTQLVLDVCKKEAPDFSILFHGGSNTTACMLNTDYGAYVYKVEANEIENIVAEKCAAAGVRYRATAVPEHEKKAVPVSFNLPSAMHHCCGTPCVTFESNQGLTDHGNVIYGFEEIYESHMITMTEVIRYYLKKFNKI